MIKIMYEDDSILVVEKPAGMESQSSRGFAADVVSELKKHLSTNESTKRTGVRGKTGKQVGGPYVGVIHRLDKPVSGVMVYAKTQAAANALSEQVRSHRMEKIYHAVVCGKFVDNVGNYVDNLLKDGRTNCSKIVDKPVKDSRRAELSYRVLETVEVPGAAEVPETFTSVFIRFFSFFPYRGFLLPKNSLSNGKSIQSSNKFSPKILGININHSSNLLHCYMFSICYICNITHIFQMSIDWGRFHSFFTISSSAPPVYTC